MGKQYRSRLRQYLSTAEKDIVYYINIVYDGHFTQSHWFYNNLVSNKTTSCSFEFRNENGNLDISIIKWNSIKYELDGAKTISI